MKALSQALHQLYDPVLDEPVPERLRARRSRWRAAAIAAGWAALGLGAGVLAGWQLHAWRASVPPQAEVPGFVKRAAVAHAVYSPEVRHPVEVGADQEAHLVSWLSKRLGAPLKPPQLEEVGYRLVGGRLLPGESGEVAQFMYENTARNRLTLYIRPAAPRQGDTAFRYARENGIDVFYWTDSRFGYALSGNTGREDMLRLATLVFQQHGK